MDNNQYNLWLEGINLFEENKQRPLTEKNIQEENIDLNDPNYDLYFQTLGWDYQFDIDRLIKNKFQLGIQEYNSHFDFFAMRNKSIPEKLGWEFAKLINQIKDELFEEEFIKQTNEESYESFKTMFYKGITLYDQNTDSKDDLNLSNISDLHNSGIYIGYLFSSLRTLFGKAIIKYAKNPNRNLQELEVQKVVNKILKIILFEQKEYNPITQKINLLQSQENYDHVNT